jgi:hypothetical protein
MTNAVHISEYNQNTVVERNLMHDFQLKVSDLGAIEVHSFADGTRINGNTIKDIGKNCEGTNACIRIHGSSEMVRISNNIIYNSVSEEDEVYAFRIDGTNHQASRIIHNTVFNLDNGLMLEDYGDIMDFGIFNNLFQVNDEYFTCQGNSGTFSLSNNLYFTDPVPDPWMPYFSEPGRQVGNIDFVNAAGGDFRLMISSEKAICSGTLLSPSVDIDIKGVVRTATLPDIGACELDGKRIWTGIDGSIWSSSENWLNGDIPDVNSYGIILPSPFDPIVSNDITIRGLLLKQGSALQVNSPQVNIISQ